MPLKPPDLSKEQGQEGEGTPAAQSLGWPRRTGPSLSVTVTQLRRKTLNWFAHMKIVSGPACNYHLKDNEKQYRGTLFVFNLPLNIQQKEKI